MSRPSTSTLFFLALIALCVLGTSFGWHRVLERELHDRAVRLGLFAWDSDDPPPIVIVAIDDNALQHLEDTRDETWPWSREVHAQVIDELRLHGAKTIAMDISFTQLRDGGTEGDEALRKAIERHGGVILASRLASVGVGGAVDGESPDASMARVPRELQKLGWEGSSLRRSLKEREAFTAEQGNVIRDAIEKGRASGVAPLGVARMVDEAWMIEKLRTSAVAATPADDTLVFPLIDPEPGLPTPAIGVDAFAFGNTDVGSRSGDADGVVRRVPLWTRDGERVYPLLGLAAAMHYSGGRVEHLDGRRTGFAGGSVPRDIPTAVGKLPGFESPVGGVMRLRWPRSGAFRYQFDVDGERRVVSVTELIDIAKVRSLIARVDGKVSTLRDEYEWPVDKAYASRAKVLAEGAVFTEAWRNAWEAQRGAWAELTTLAAAIRNEQDPRADGPDLSFAAVIADDLKVDVASASAIGQVEKLLARDPLPDLNGALVLIGSVATKQANDLVPTSIDPETPGVFVHAVVAHNVLSGATLAPVSRLVVPLLVAFFGFLGVLIGAKTNQWIGMMVSAAICGAWFFVSAWLLDARLGTGSMIAGAMVAMVVLWLARATYKALIELRARRRTEERFKSYVAPDVVDILVNNPALSSMEPQRRELTIMFTDIAGFTTMAERLGTDRTTEVLGEYLREMTDVLESTGATLDKYLGDGIMAFWGAPLTNDQHAHNAVHAAIEMLDRVDDLNERGVFGEVGPAAIRIGIATGTVSVGDFGNPPHRSAYTVIGDSVNLSARLESANKQLGTTILMNRRCAELVGDAYRSRAVGALIVVGKSKPEPIREVVGGRSLRGEKTEEWIAASESASTAFQGRRWAEARVAFERLRDEFSDEKIALLHLDAIARYEAGDDSSPSIALTEK